MLLHTTQHVFVGFINIQHLWYTWKPFMFTISSNKYKPSWLLQGWNLFLYCTSTLRGHPGFRQLLWKPQVIATLQQLPPWTLPPVPCAWEAPNSWYAGQQELPKKLYNYHWKLARFMVIDSSKFLAEKGKLPSRILLGTSSRTSVHYQEHHQGLHKEYQQGHN